MQKRKKKLHTFHRFLDEAGDCTFYGKKRKSILGTEGVSNCFILGMIKFKEPLEPIRQKIFEMQKSIAEDPYFQVPSVIKKKENKGYFFHAKDDLPEVKKLFFDFIKTLKFSFEAVVARKSVQRFTTRHKDREEYFYADLLSHLLKNKLQKGERMVLNIAEKGTSTKNNNLTLALEKAKERFIKKLNRSSADVVLEGNKIRKRSDVQASIVFNETNPLREPLLNVADYMCWAIQRVFEKGETRYYDFIKEKVSLVVDLYDIENYKDGKNFYSPKRPLTGKNKISPQLH
jgi:hypothetical protein